MLLKYEAWLCMKAGTESAGLRSVQHAGLSGTWTPFTLDPESWIRPGSDPAMWINGQCKCKTAGSDQGQYPADQVPAFTHH